MRIGVRCSSATTLAALREALSANLVDEVAMLANYSVREAEADGEFHLLYRGGVVVVRTLDRSRLVQGLLIHLFGHGKPPPGLLRVDALALVGEGVAVLAPSALRHQLAHIERRLARRGLAVVDAPFADVDSERAELVVPSLPGSVNPQPLAVFGSPGSDGRAGSVATAGRYALAAWAFAAGLDDAAPATRAEAAQLALASAIAPDQAEATVVLEHLGQLLAQLPVGAVPLHPPADAAAALQRLAGRG